jgi:alanyl-tRNA synthetase
VKATDIRKGFLDSFARHGHRIVPSSPLVPQNDPTLFFTNAGMVQFKDVFTGAEKPPGPRAASSQKCLRVSGKHNDLENVGRTPRHHTFFEMLGNFSFGDYFKKDAIGFAWELLTGTWKIAPERLWVTVYEEDDEAHTLWREVAGMPAERIQRLGAKENFWMMGETGPCGPCSEIHYDHGLRKGADPGAGPATEDPRYVEIWNLVFMQFEQHADGSRTALPRPSIDTGMGLERIAAALQGVSWNYDTDLFVPLIAKVAAAAGSTYGAAEDSDTAMRVIADHARAAAFLVADGVMPSNDGRGYVLRRIMRRAIRFGRTLGFERPFLHEVTAEVIHTMDDAYPELTSRKSAIHEVVLGEEERFLRTLDRGSRLLEEELAAAGGKPLPGHVAFKLYDTFGFPLDLTELVAAERGVLVDTAGFEAEMDRQREAGRAAWKGSGEQAVGELWKKLREEHGVTSFTGYDSDSGDARVLALVRSIDEDYEQVPRLAAGERGIVLLDRTPFYAESGGQVGDSGRIGSFVVRDTSKASGLHLHVGEAEEPIAVGDEVTVEVDAARRNRTRRNHTGTHLLHAALRKVLGDHVTQKGSLVAPDRLRFDFAHPKPMTAAEIEAVEALVNEEILANKALEVDVDDLDRAVSRGAMALFGEKYDARVRVVAVPGFSVELCGGTHTSRTGDIGLLRIVSESGVAAGVRRIEAQTGTGALAVQRDERERLAEVAKRLKVNPDRVVPAIERLMDERRALERKIAELQSASARSAASGLASAARTIGGVQVLAGRFDEGDLKGQADRLRDQLGPSLVVLFAEREGRVQLLAAVTKDLTSRLHAGRMVQKLAPLVAGRGGGRPDLAEAGGTDPSGIPAAIAATYEIAAEILGASAESAAG